ncbi:MAG: ATP-binding protein [Gemmataceae bacterium]|nr:ATP-binding protein [Gemmataceae bacterium]MDW8244867.1 ATP-binding protein [Thermogemmata sp.]
MARVGKAGMWLGFVPEWCREGNELAVLENLLARWEGVCGWRGCGIVVPTGDELAALTVRSGVASTEAPPEAPDALRRLRGGESGIHYSNVDSSGRFFAAISLAGRGLGAVWAESPREQPWGEFEQAYLILTGRVLEHAPVVQLLAGPLVDPQRLHQRLADAAVIAGRMAHDFDNILTGIVGFSDLALPLVPSGSQAAAYIAEIAKVGQRGIQFTQQLHQLSRSGQYKPTAGSIALALAREEGRLKPQMHPHLRLEKELPVQLPNVALDTNVLQIVLGHILENAIEACPQGGSVRISARVHTLSAAEARTYLGRVRPGDHVVIQVVDSGPGLKPEVRRRLFVEPFFTTKVRHRGLGLAIVYRILWVHEGGINLEPALPPATGTQVRIALPVATTPTPASAPSAAMPKTSTAQLLGG